MKQRSSRAMPTSLLLVCALAAVCASKEAGGGESLTEKVAHTLGFGRDSPSDHAAAGIDEGAEALEGARLASARRAADAYEELKAAAENSASGQAAKAVGDHVTDTVTQSVNRDQEAKDPRSTVGRIIDSVLGKSHASGADRVADVTGGVLGSKDHHESHHEGHHEGHHDAGGEHHERQQFDAREVQGSAAAGTLGSASGAGVDAEASNPMVQSAVCQGDTSSSESCAKEGVAGDEHESKDPRTVAGKVLDYVMGKSHAPGTDRVADTAGSAHASVSDAAEGVRVAASHAAGNLGASAAEAGESIKQAAAHVAGATGQTVSGAAHGAADTVASNVHAAAEGVREGAAKAAGAAGAGAGAVRDVIGSGAEKTKEGIKGATERASDAASYAGGIASDMAQRVKDSTIKAGSDAAESAKGAKDAAADAVKHAQQAAENTVTSGATKVGDAAAQATITAADAMERGAAGVEAGAAHMKQHASSVKSEL